MSRTQGPRGSSCRHLILTSLVSSRRMKRCLVYLFHHNRILTLIRLFLSSLSPAGWYESDPDPELGAAPCIFTSVTPAWNNMNLIRLADKIKSPLVFAHVRASTAGSVSESNCKLSKKVPKLYVYTPNFGELTKDCNIYRPSMAIWQTHVYAQRKHCRFQLGKYKEKRY